MLISDSRELGRARRHGDPRAASAPDPRHRRGLGPLANLRTEAAPGERAAM